MKKLSFLLFFFVSFQFSHAQNEWQEHLSHDRLAYGHLGHFITNGKLVLVMGNELAPMNTIEIIEGNTKKSQEVITDYFTFQVKTTRTGIDSKEILLANSYDYDIPGFGAHSLHERNDEIIYRNILIERVDNIYVQVLDAFMHRDMMDPKECIIDNKRHVLLDYQDEIEEVTDLEHSFRFHEGFIDTPYKIENGLFKSTDSNIPGSITLNSNNDRLFNNPYENRLVQVEGNSLNHYSYADFSLVRTDILMNQAIDIQFVDGGFYYLTESEGSYIVFYYSDENLDSELFLELLKTDEMAEFNIRNFEVVGEDIFFLGTWRSPLIREAFSYVQKRSLTEDFAPIRKDIELESVTATRELMNNDNYKYTYTLTVNNLSEDTIRHFTAYTSIYPDSGPWQYKKKDVTFILPPGESQEIEGELTNIGWAKSKLTFHIEGVDFGIDSDYSNNSFTADVIILSDKETKLNRYSITPNIGTDNMVLNGELNEIDAAFISDIRGHKIKLDKEKIQEINISNLPQGKYWLEIQVGKNLEKLPFIKI